MKSFGFFVLNCHSGLVQQQCVCLVYQKTCVQSCLQQTNKETSPPPTTTAGCGRQRLVDLCEFQARLGYVVRICLNDPSCPQTVLQVKSINRLGWAFGANPQEEIFVHLEMGLSLVNKEGKLKAILVQKIDHNGRNVRNELFVCLGFFPLIMEKIPETRISKQYGLGTYILIQSADIKFLNKQGSGPIRRLKTSSSTYRSVPGFLLLLKTKAHNFTGNRGSMFSQFQR